MLMAKQGWRLPSLSRLLLGSAGGLLLVGALLVIPAAAARLLSQSLKGFFWISVLIATVSTLCGILLPIVFDLPIPSGAAIILVAGIAFALAAIARGVVPSLKGNIG